MARMRYKRYMKKISKLVYKHERDVLSSPGDDPTTSMELIDTYFCKIRDVVKEYDEEKERVRQQNARKGVNEDA